ncbi:NADH-quinone oxidoreductase subunit NuoE [Chloroflexota bacterium]
MKCYNSVVIVSDVSELSSILTPYEGQNGSLIPILQKVQKAYGYLSSESIAGIAEFLHISESEVYGVASFYAQFRFTQRGEHLVKVCQGTACHVRGGARIMDDVVETLGVKAGGTTEDYKFSLERVACVGCCALAPVVVVDDEVHAKMTPIEAKKLISNY